MDLSVDICHSRKAIKCLLQNIYLMLGLLYHKCNPLFTTVVYGSISASNEIITWEKNVTRYYFCYLRVHKKLVYKTFLPWRNGWCWILLIRMFLNLWQCQIIWNLFAGSTTIILCLFTVYGSWNMFFTKIWFLKTSTKIVKHELWVAKTNPKYCKRMNDKDFIYQWDTEIHIRQSSSLDSGWKNKN